MPADAPLTPWPLQPHSPHPLPVQPHSPQPSPTHGHLPQCSPQPSSPQASSPFLTAAAAGAGVGAASACRAARSAVVEATPVVERRSDTRATPSSAGRKPIEHSSQTAADGRSRHLKLNIAHHLTRTRSPWNESKKRRSAWNIQRTTASAERTRDKQAEWTH